MSHNFDIKKYKLPVNDFFIKELSVQNEYDEDQCIRLTWWRLTFEGMKECWVAIDSQSVLIVGWPAKGSIDIPGGDETL